MMANGSIQQVEAQPLAVPTPQPVNAVPHGSYQNRLLIAGMLRRWYLVFISVVVISGVATPLIWKLVMPKYRATAAIRVAPIIPAILFSDSDSDRTLPMYDSFVNTQAQFMTSEMVLQRVADDLSDRDLAFFRPLPPVADIAQRLHIPASYLEKLGIATASERPDATDVLREAVQGGIIMAQPGRRSELIQVTVDCEDREEARILADAVVRAYMASEGSRSSQSDDAQLTILEEERRSLAEKIRMQQESIRRLAEQYGTTALGGRRDMMLERVADLQKEKTRVEARRIALEARLQLLENTSEPESLPQQIAEREQQYINADATVSALTGRLAQIEQELIVARQNLKPNHPDLQRTETLLEAFQERLDERRKELAEQFAEAVKHETGQGVSQALALARAELEQTRAHEEILTREMTTENEATIMLGRQQLTIEDQQKQLAMNEQLYDTVLQRIQQLQVEQKRPGRISVAFNASTLPLPNRRNKMILATLFGSVFAGLGLAFLQTKRDQRVRTPEEILWRIGVPVLGTTTKGEQTAHKRNLLADDYHAIRSNLGLRSDGQVPHKLAITSADIGEGKTTLAINLATSLAATGRRVLLIDGDFSKADVARYLGVKTNGESVVNVLLGRKSFDESVRTTRQPGLDFLPGYCSENAQATAALNSDWSHETINRIGQNYDHVIIDTPPILIGPMALLWAKLADGVVLSSMAGRTQYPDLQEALERLTELEIPVIGNVLANVRPHESYSRYGYYYRESAKKSKPRETQLLMPEKGETEG